MMKKILVRTMMMIIMVTLILLVNWMEPRYTREDCEVVECFEDVVTVVDQCGFLWDFQAEGLKVGDKVDLKMHTSFTDSNIFDDEIIGIKEAK